MKRLLLVMAIGIGLILSSGSATVVEVAPKSRDASSYTLAQEPIGLNFTSPAAGEYLSGNITIKVNATVIAGANVMLRWLSDSWIDITDLYNSTSRLYEYPMDVSCLPSGNATFEAKQVTSHGTARASVEAYIDWEQPPILIVDDYDNATVTDYYTDALESLGFSNGSDYNVWRTQVSGSPNDIDLLGYQFVIWFTSDYGNPLSLDERNDIQTYLMDPSVRKMLLTGTEIAWSAYNIGFFEGWLSSNFGVNGYIRDGGNSETLLGSVGSPYSGVSYTYGGGDGSRAGGGADWVSTMELSLGVIEYQSSGYDEYAATGSPFVNSLFFGFAVDAISNASGRMDVLNRTLSHFGLYESPLVDVIAPSSGSLENSPLELDWTSSSMIPGMLYNPSYSIYIDGKLIVTGLSSETHTLPLTHGNHTIRVVCEDNYGQRGYANVSIECDAIPPLIEPRNHPTDSVLKGNTLIEFNLTDDHLLNAIAKWDSGSWTSFNPPYETLLPTGNGIHTITIIAFDAAGNQNAKGFGFTCDDVLPNIALVSLANGSIMASESSISFAINDTHLDRVEYRWDQTSDSEFIFPFEVSLPAGDGAHDLYVNATDLAGNYRVGHFQFITDDMAPSITLSTIANNSVLKTGSPLNLIVTDMHLENVGYIWDLADSGISENSDIVLYAPPLEGENWLFVNATDVAGNRASASFLFIVDNTAPKVTLTSPLEGSTVPMDTEVTIEVTDLYLVSVFFKWDSGDWTEWSPPYVAYTPAGVGNHALFVNATDNAGNSILSVFVFITEEPSTITSSTTTTFSPTSPTEPQLDLPASLGIMGIGVYLGIIIGIFIWPRLRGNRPSTGYASG
ncbi:MAG: hypothetical protein ACFE9W_08255 [Promethearchaeota archaeon]